MSTQFYDLDINAKLPIIRVESSSDFPATNGISEPSNNNNNHVPGQNGMTIKQPSFRLVDNSEYKRRTHTAAIAVKKKGPSLPAKDSYFHYEEPSAEDLLERVEYDMDIHDIQWLEIFNNKVASNYGYKISEADFEKIMDRLEKESYFETKKSGHEISLEVDEDAVCAICNDGDCQNANQIIFCDMCDLAVHQECYGVPYVPEGQWLCRRCLQSPSKNVQCVLCPNLGGAFKQTDNGKWAHVICALWVPEVCFANTVFLEPIDSIDNIPAARWKLNCYICKQKNGGACIQCHKPNCYVPFHVTCAQQAGLYMKIKTFKYDTPDGPLTDVKKEAFCDLHGPKDRSKGGGMYSEGDSDPDDVDTHAYKRWKQAKKEKMKKTRKVLAEKRAKAFNPIAEPTIRPEKIEEISKLLTMKSGGGGGAKRKSTSVSSLNKFEELRQAFIQQIQGYWLEKRRQRHGVPLLRRLQVSYNSGNPKTTNISLVEDLDREKYTRLRYDLERARLLVGEIQKREVFKKRLLNISRDIIEKKFQIIDQDDPPTGE